jgi:hypothetical protein
MAEAILKFDLNDEDDRRKHKIMLKAEDLGFAIFQITHNTKKEIEWSLENKDIDKYETLELVFDKIWEVIKEYDINVDDL